MKRNWCSVLLLSMIAYSPSSFAGSGFVNSVIEVQAPQGVAIITKDSTGNTIVKLDPSLSSEKDFGLFAKARAFLLNKYGEEAREWPLTIDPKNQTFSFFSKNGEKQTLRFSDEQ